MDDRPPLAGLDFSTHRARMWPGDLSYLTDIPGGGVVFAIEASGTRVAAVQLARDALLVLLADHVFGERPILVFRVEDLAARMETLQSRGGSQRGPSRSVMGRAVRSILPPATGSR